MRKRKRVILGAPITVRFRPLIEARLKEDTRFDDEGTVSRVVRRIVDQHYTQNGKVGKS